MRLNKNMIPSIKFLILFYFFFPINILSAQNTDSIQKALSEKSIDLLKKEVNAIDKESKSLKKYYQETILKKALEEEDTEDILWSSLELSFIERQNDDLDEALIYIEKAIVFFDKAENDSLKMAIWRQKGAVLFLQAKYEQALLGYYKAKEIAENINDEYFSFLINMNIGLVKLQINKIQEGLDTFLEVLSFLDNIGEHNFSTENKDFYIKTLMAISKVYIELKDYESAMYYHKLGLNKSIEFNDIRREVVFLSGMGRIYGEKGAYEKSIEMLTKGEEKLLEYGNYKRLFSFIYLLKGDTFLK